MANNSHETLTNQMKTFEENTHQALIKIREKLKMTLNNPVKRKVHFLVKRDQILVRGEIISEVENLTTKREAAMISYNVLLQQYKDQQSEQTTLKLLSQSHAIITYTNTIIELATLLNQLTTYDFNNN